jgi:hypothetical protein
VTTTLSETHRSEFSGTWSLASAVNNEAVASSCLLRSPDLPGEAEVLLQRGYRSAAEAYNAAIDAAKTDLLVFAHQDVYLPEGWERAAFEGIKLLSKTDPDWGVLGVWGVSPSGGRAGFVYDGGWRRTLGGPFSGGQQVDTLDELLLIVRKSSGLRFDPQLRGFHMYGTDICLEARRQGRKCYAIGAFCIHNTNQYRMLPLQFWQAYFFIRRKWKGQLPIQTPCITITRWCWPMLRWNVVRAINLATGRDKPPAKRIADPRELCNELHFGPQPQPR